jgi:hypothetical protein
MRSAVSLRSARLLPSHPSLHVHTSSGRLSPCDRVSCAWPSQGGDWQRWRARRCGASAARVVVASAGSVCWHAGRVLAKRRGECELTLISMYSTALNWYRTHTLTCRLSSFLANRTHTPRSRHFQSPCGCIGASPIHATVSFCRKGDLTLQNAESHKVFDPSCQSYSREGVCLCGSRSLRLVIRSPPLLKVHPQPGSGVACAAG